MAKIIKLRGPIRELTVAVGAYSVGGGACSPRVGAYSRGGFFRGGEAIRGFTVLVLLLLVL